MSCPFLFMGRFNIATGNIPEPEPEVAMKKGVSDNLLKNPYYRSSPIESDDESDFATMGNVPSSSALRISGPGGNQIIIPIRNVVASLRNPESPTNDIEFIIRMPRSQANLLITDIHEAQSRQGISTRGR